MVQHLLDIETYRTLALLGLPEARRLAPSIGLAEKRLGEVTERMRRAVNDLDDNNQMLNELTALAADVEAGVAASLFRFGASRAYEQIVTQHLQTIGERRDSWFSDLDFVSRPTDGAGVAHLCRHRGPPGESVASPDQSGQPAADSCRCRTRETESATAKIDERADTSAAASADYGRRAIGGGDYLLHDGPVQLPGKSRA